MPERDLVYLKQIMDCIFDLELFVKDCNENSFIADKKTQSAAIRMLELIGEVTKRLSDELKHNNQNIAWKKIAGLRDVPCHCGGSGEIPSQPLNIRQQWMRG